MRWRCGAARSGERMSAAAVPGACDACLRRAWLVGSLSAQIERSLAGGPGARARELLALPDRALAAVIGGDEEAVQRAAARDPRLLRGAVAGSGSWACCLHDPAFPQSVLTLGDAPRVLFGRGEPRLLGRLRSDACVTIVGARRPSVYGREVAEVLGRELAVAGLAVISGMALGIDSCAHAGALAAGGFTVAVLGSGADVSHPARMRGLHGRIAESGLVLSELPPGTAPRRWTFPARNRIMAALSAVTVVVEGRARSGSLITATLAGEGGREVGAVPGRVGSATAAGPNDLLHQGAHVIRDAQDVLDVLAGIAAREGGELTRPAGPAVPEALVVVLDAVDRGEGTHDEVAAATGLDATATAAALTRLELAGLLACDSAGRYVRTQLRASV
jgi:DNA processing protein